MSPVGRPVLDTPTGSDLPTSVRTAARLIRDGSLTADTLAEMCLHRVRAVDPQVRAFVGVDEPAVRAQARELTREARAGRLRGPLHGVPVAVKDVIDVAGVPTRCGSNVTDPVAAAADAPAVARLRAAGALIFGKTHTHEFAHGVTTPPTRNPWDLARIPGGSSGGSAAAVASGQCLAALGSDTGGSIRVPSALCGVSGLRPGRDDIPVDGVAAFSPRLDTCGPIGRDVRDLALLHAVLSGRRGTVPSDVGGLTAGIVGAQTGELGDGVGEAVAAVADVMAEAGVQARPVSVPPFEAWSAPRAQYVLTDFLDVHRDADFYPQRTDRYTAEVAGYLRHAETIPAAARTAAIAALDELARCLAASCATVDVVVLPTTPVTAPLVRDCAYDPDQAGRAAVIGTLMRLCGPFSWCGWAAVSVPCGFDAGGMPIGVQIAGRSVSTVLAVAAAYQDRTGHHLREPMLIPSRLRETPGLR